MNRQQTSTLETRYQIKLAAAICLGIFLFLLFFLPFEYRKMAFNENLLFILGLSAITFVIIGFFRIILPYSMNKLIRSKTYKISNEVIIILLIWVFNSIAYIFYLRYVGLHQITLFSAFKISLFSSFPSIILKLADVNKSLRDQLKHMVDKNIKLEMYDDKERDTRPMELLLSDTKSDKLEIHPDNIMLVKSADNYVNIIYKNQEHVKQKMLRNTIKNIEAQLKKYPEFLRCHRSCIVNSIYIVNLTNNYKGHHLKLLDYEEEIPVSRQYILSIKNYLEFD
ncbi:MAG: LytTR family transcriptional regulator [Bacteroidales bacterium]|nr:LytTR family transcriptional regulator [Bacteroidales bacterium]